MLNAYSQSVKTNGTIKIYFFVDLFCIFGMYIFKELAPWPILS